MPAAAGCLWKAGPKTRSVPLWRWLDLFDGQGIAAVVYTDIQRDGMSVGPNLRATGELAGALKTPVIASGGISGLEDIRKVMTLSSQG